MMLHQLQSFFSSIAGKLLDYELEKVSSSTSGSKFNLETLERNLKSLSCKATDIEKQVMNIELSGKRKRKREVEHWLEEVQIIESEFFLWHESVQEEGFIRRLFGGDSVQKMYSRVEELIQQSRDFGELVLDVDESSRGQPLLTNRLFGKAFDENLQRLWECLVIDKVSSIGIYGMGGVGKTTLAKHMHNLLLDESPFRVCWITISQQFRIRKLQDDIAKGIGVNLFDEDDEDKRAVELNQALSRQKDFVLVLDDMWEYINLEKLGHPLRVMGCSLVITTRLLQVCQRVGCRRNFEVKTLHADESWNLFKKTLGGWTKLDPQVQTVAKSMAKECAGLPLGIITLARSMKEVTDIHEWRNAYAELKEYPMEQDDMKNEVFRILEYSFDRLDPNYYQDKGKKNKHTKLQLCFLYCSLYPEDHKLQRVEIIKRFISEKLLDRRKSRKEEFDQGHAILNKLVNASLLESDDGGSAVKMHDLIRAMALKITGCNETRFMVRARLSLDEIPNEEEWSQDLEKVSIMHNNISEIQPGTSPNCPELSTLLLNENPLSFIPDTFFQKMQVLSVLDLSYTRVKKLPNSVSELGTLNVLCLRDCIMLVALPNLGKLTSLRELDLTRTKLKEMPKGTENLVKLRFLCLWGMRDLEMLPEGLLSRISYLQHLSLPSHVEPPVKEIGKLKRLEEFCGTFDDVHKFNQFVIHRQGQGCLSSCDIKVGMLNYYWEVYNYIDENVGGRRVVLEQCCMDKSEGKDPIFMLPEFTQHLVLSNCEGLSNGLMDDLPKLNNPTSLQICEISHCNGIECILIARENKELESCKFLLKALQEIWLISLPNLTSVMKWEQGAARSAAFSSLKKLHIEGCNEITKLGLSILDFRRMEEIIVVNCENMEEIIEVEADRRRERVYLPKLKVLCLSLLPGLRTICRTRIACESIEEIDLYSCPNLKKLPLFLPFVDGLPAPPKTLKQIRMYPKDKQWWESLAWENPTHGHLLSPFVRFW